MALRVPKNSLDQESTHQEVLVLAAAKKNLTREFACFFFFIFKLTHFFACNIEFDTRLCCFYEFDQWTVFSNLTQE